MFLKEFAKGLINTLIPKVCLLCGKRLKSKKFLCEKCQDFERNISPFCSKCGIGISPDSKTKLCQRCRSKKFYFIKNLSPFIFKEPLSKLIHLFKYKSFRFLGDFFSEKLIEFIQNLHIPLEDYHFISSVPLHKRKLREREFNQSKLLAKNISNHFGIPYKEVLGVKQYLDSQVNKTAKKRTIDIRGNFYIIGEVKDKNIILIDDVFTTGATLSECAKTLKEKGTKKVLTITLAIKRIN